LLELRKYLINLQEIPKEEVDSLYKKIGRNVMKYRKEKKVTQLELTYAIGYKSVGLISQAELCLNGKHFNIEHLYKIAKTLDIDICEFFK